MQQRADYAETLTPPPSWWVMGGCVVASVFWVFLVATPPAVAVVAAAVAILVVGAILTRYSVKVAIDVDGLHAGAAVLAWPYVGSVEVLDAAQTHLVIGVDADARAHLVVRTYCGGAVKVGVDDERDPTPYWVISTRHPEKLALHLRPRSMRD